MVHHTSEHYSLYEWYEMNTIFCKKYNSRVLQLYRIFQGEEGVIYLFIPINRFIVFSYNFYTLINHIFKTSELKK